MHGGPSAASTITLFLAGDVMTGRGIDQILPYPSKPRIPESYLRSASDYVALAERATGKIGRRVDFRYVWGDALIELGRARPDARVVNLETAVTASDESWPGKGIAYRMHPQNVGCLTAANIDCCVLANNHVLDWGRQGLLETLEVLHRAGIRTAGAGRDEHEAAAPAVLEVPGKGRVLVFAFGASTSGIPREWAAGEERPGVSILGDLDARTVERIAERVHVRKRIGDVVVLSIHWGGNWGFEILPEERLFAHRLVEVAGIDVVHGHSSHHVKGIEVHCDRAVLYGCGDLLNDYEGIGGHEEYRGDLGLLYLVTVDPRTGSIERLVMVPTSIRHFRINRAREADARWLQAALDREGEKLGTRFERASDGYLIARHR
jgi:poly-gamma-glutamate capsule biosynthesis protein CapA/YwtB (metallophosphatase superfamily)